MFALRTLGALIILVSLRIQKTVIKAVLLRRLFA